MNKFTTEIKQKINERTKTINEHSYKTFIQECASITKVRSIFKSPSISKQKK